MALDKAEFAAFNAAAGKVAITEPVKILILGDSLSDFCRGYNWADILEMRLKQLNPKSRIFNYACRGDSVQTISSRLSGGTSVFMAGHYRGLRDNQYDLVIIFAGHNDTVAEKKSGFQTPRLNEEQIRRYYNTITGELKKISPAAPVVVISPVSMPQEIHEASKAPYRFGIPALVKKYDAVVRQIASANNWNYVDVYTAFDKLAAGKAAYFNKDGVHINERGNLFLAMQVMESFPEFSDAVERAIENVPRWEVDTPAAGVWVLRNENSQWKGMNASGVVPISNSRLVVRKVFDLSCLPPAALEQGDKLFLRLFYGIVDNSMSKPGPKKGLNEKFYIALNGEKFIFNTSDDRFPLTFDPTKRRRQHWCDIEIPRTLLNGKTLTVELSSMETKGDDFLYPGFDGSKAAVASSVS
jgi:lysophospholipase L1-like esterase